jgi:hypothetical protein
MTLVNSYAALDEFKALPEFDTEKPADDVFIERLLERCSREFDGDTGHWFYAHQQTRYFDLPCGRTLELDAPLIAVTHLTNGDDTNIAATEYRLFPLNGPHKSEIRIKQSSSTIWQTNTDGETEGVISVNATWGYVDRTSTDPEAMVAILNSKAAVLALALSVYKRRYGVGTDGAATVTGAGVVITPRDKSPEYLATVERYRRHL